MSKQLFTVLLVFIPFTLNLAQEIRNEFLVPNIMCFQTLKGDFHMHTVFSDGNVWPDVRVMEAWKEGLDIIAITDHVEILNPLLPQDRNKPYEIAKKEADKRGILLVQGAEITRKLPEECGHLIALFLSDVNKLGQVNYIDAINEASKQGAFIFWAHPGWYIHQPDTTVWFEIFTNLVIENKLQGIEIVNWKSWYPEGFSWCLEKNLTIMANSDIHNPASFIYDFCKGDHRPITLIFSKDKSLEGVKEALMQHRTVAYFKRGFYNQLMGKEEYLKELFFQSIDIDLIQNTEKSLDVFLKNNSDLDFILVKKNPDERLNYQKNYFLYGRSCEQINIKKVTPIKDDEIELYFIIENLLTAPGKPLNVKILIRNYL